MKGVAELARSLFKIDGKPAELTQGEVDIFSTIVSRYPHRTAVRAYTQYGKSLTTGLGLIVRLTTYPEKWIIVAGTQKQGRVIGGYTLKHLFDNSILYKQLEITDSLERLKRERSKDHLTFKGGGELLILTADVRNRQRQGEALMEFGAPNVIMDGAGLLDDELNALTMRMVGGATDNFVIKLGNPFRRNHFMRSCNDPLWRHITINYEQGIKEGRVTEQFINEMRSEAFFDILYNCEFPGEDAEGLLALDLLKEAAETNAQEGKPVGIGIDVASTGTDLSVLSVVRGEKQSKQQIIQGHDTMELVGEAHALQDKEKADIMGVDVIGVGTGVYDRLKEKNNDRQDSFNVKHLLPVNFGASAIEESREGFPGFCNVRAEAFIEVKRRVENSKGQFLSPFDDADLWRQVSIHKIAYDSKRRYKIAPKEEVKKQLGGKSPDKADALAIAVWCLKWLEIGHKPLMFTVG